MRLVLLALATVFCAGAAFAQDMPCRPPDGITQKATKTFVENYNAAQRALNAKDWAGAIGGAALARPHAIYGVQQAILLQIEIVAYDGWGGAGVAQDKTGGGNPVSLPIRGRPGQLPTDVGRNNFKASCTSTALRICEPSRSVAD